VSQGQGDLPGRLGSCSTVEARSREELERRRRVRRREVRRRRAVALAVLLALAAAVAAAAAWVFHGDSTSPAAAGGPGAPSPAGPARPVRADGSLGAPAVKRACSLLTRAEIRAQLGGPVGRPTPIWPYCQWLIGKDAFLAVHVSPRTPLDSSPWRAPLLQTTSGLGDRAYYGTNRYLYIGDGKASYWLLFQKAGEFTGIRTPQLQALGRKVVQRARSGAAGGEQAPFERALLGGAKPSRRRPLVVYFGGDSLAAGPSWAFAVEAAKRATIRALPEYQVGTGLLRADYFDWTRHLKAVLNARNPDVAVFMAGANDSQDAIVGGRYHPVGTPVWKRVYRARVARTMDVLAAGGRKVVWVAMPPMREQRLYDGMAAVDRIFAAEARKRPAVTFVDTWKLFRAPGGGYADSVGGTVVRLDDGIHLNVAGSYLLARAVLKQVRRLGNLD
jgi:lysophospholipase L1-like esterase